MSAQTEPDQVHVVPVTASGAEEPDQEVPEELTDSRDSPGGRDVIRVGKGSPVHDNDVNVTGSEESGSDHGVDFAITVAVPSVDDDFRGPAANVVGGPYGVGVAVHKDLRGCWVRSVESQPVIEVTHLIKQNKSLI